MSKGFKDSVVLTQNSVGVRIPTFVDSLDANPSKQHCSISAPSLCSQKYIRDYFIDGTLPPPGTVCEPISQPFPSSATSTGDSGDQALLSANLTPDEMEILEAVLQLSKDPGIARPTGPMLF